jgi:hypothetical protein
MRASAIGVRGSVAILLTSRSDGLYLEAIIVKNHAAIEEILVKGGLNAGQ